MPARGDNRPAADRSQKLSLLHGESANGKLTGARFASSRSASSSVSESCPRKRHRHAVAVANHPEAMDRPPTLRNSVFPAPQIDYSWDHGSPIVSPARSWHLTPYESRRGGYASDLLAATPGDRPARRRAGVEIVFGVLRYQAQLDFLIEHYSGAASASWISSAAGAPSGRLPAAIPGSRPAARRRQPERGTGQIHGVSLGHRIRQRRAAQSGPRAGRLARSRGRASHPEWPRASPRSGPGRARSSRA
jgi:hypothetical protein